NDLFLYDRVTSEISVVSHAAGMPQQGGDGRTIGADFTISADGHFVAFSSEAENLLPGGLDNNRQQDVFIRDPDTDAIECASQRQGPLSVSANGPSSGVVNQGEGLLAISSNGRIVAYESDATNAVPGQVDTNNAADVFLFDRQAGTTILVS